MNFDVAIVGSGLAGLSVALHLANERKVVVISKRSLRDGASDWAQGGIAAVLAGELPADRRAAAGRLGRSQPDLRRPHRPVASDHPCGRRPARADAGAARRREQIASRRYQRHLPEEGVCLEHDGSRCSGRSGWGAGVTGRIRSPENVFSEGFGLPVKQKLRCRQVVKDRRGVSEK